MKDPASAAAVLLAETVLQNLQNQEVWNCSQSRVRAVCVCACVCACVCVRERETYLNCNNPGTVGSGLLELNLQLQQTSTTDHNTLTTHTNTHKHTHTHTHTHTGECAGGWGTLEENRSLPSTSWCFSDSSLAWWRLPAPGGPSSRILGVLLQPRVWTRARAGQEQEVTHWKSVGSGYHSNTFVWECVGALCLGWEWMLLPCW